MRLYLCRHGEALPGPVDALRELSAEGRQDVERTAAFLGAGGLRVARVGHSGLLRARQTAEILAATLAPGCTPEPMDGLLSEDTPDPAASLVRSFEADTLLVSHMPLLAYLLSRLVLDDGAVGWVRFRAGAIVALERTGSGWAIEWMLSPGLLGGE